MRFGNRVPIIKPERRFIKPIANAESWVRLCKTVNTNGLLIPLQDVQDPQRLDTYLAKDADLDWYRSVYAYPAEASKYYNDNSQSMKGYSGEAHSDRLIFDFDSKNIEAAKKDTLELLYRLADKGIEIEKNVNIFFSGCKGFHVEIPTNSKFTPDELKTICTNLATGLETFDPVVYNVTRIIRVPNTRHQITKLFKIQLEAIDFQQLSMDKIVEMAKAKVPVKDAEPVQNIQFLDEYRKVNNPARSAIVSVEEVDGIRGLDTIDWNVMPKNMPRCMYALEHGIMVPGQGERNHLFLRLAAYYRNQGYNKDKAYNALKSTARLNSRLYPEADAYSKDEIWNTVINSVYSTGPGWKSVPGASGVDPNNEMVKKYCDALENQTQCKCSLHGKAEKKSEVVQISEVSDSFTVFAENFDNNLVYTGINFIDDNMKLAKGTTTLLVGATGSGKTTLALNIMEQANALGQHTMFFSLDMHKNLVYLKLAQKLTNYGQDQILNFYKNKDTAKIAEIRKAIANKYEKTYFDFSGTLRLEEMRDKIIQKEAATGHKISLVVVDYASRINGPHADKHANATYNALKSTEIAAITDAAWVIIAQVSRATGDGCSPLRSKRAAKESGDWEEAATNVITVWRPFMGDHDRDDIMRIFLAKNRMGKELETPLRWDGAKGTVLDFDPVDLEEYKAMREEEEKQFLRTRLSKGLQ